MKHWTPRKNEYEKADPARMSKKDKVTAESFKKREETE